MKQAWILLLSIIFLLPSRPLCAQPPELKPVLEEVVMSGDPGTDSLCSTNNKSKPCLMTWKDAFQYCRSQGSVLPSIYELALYAEAERGIHGIVKVGSSESGFIDSIDRIGERIVFYYKPIKYESADQIRSNWFWSSSVVRAHPNQAYVFYDSQGVIGFEPWGEKKNPLHYAVRCLHQADHR